MYLVVCFVKQREIITVNGTVTSKDALKTVTIEISGAQGNIKQSAENINANSYDLFALDSLITINRLNAGEYTYIVTAETVGGEYVELVRSNFTIQREDGNMTISSYSLPKPMKQGDVFPVKGKIKSRSTIHEVVVEIVDSNGNYMTGDRDSGSFASYNLKKLDSNTRFDLLKAGKYVYIVRATNDAGSEVLVRQEFLVR